MLHIDKNIDLIPELLLRQRLDVISYILLVRGFAYKKPIHFR